MNITSIHPTATGQTQKQSTPSGNIKLGKDAFLQLLVAQMRNQLPSNPMNGREMISQLAKFNSVEQLINLNNSMAKLMKSQSQMSTSLVNTMASTLTGKDIKAVSNRVYLHPGEKSTIPFKLNSLADKVRISIMDSAGDIVRTEQMKNVPKGNHSWTWNGESNNGNDVPEGIYEVHITAQKGDRNVGVLTFQEGVADKVRYTQQGVELVVNGVSIPLANVKEVGT